MKFTPLFASVLAIGISVSGCNSATESAAENTANAMQDTADEIRQQGQNASDVIDEKADAIENQVQGIASNAQDAMANQASDAKAQANRTANEIDNRADAVIDAAKGK